MALEISFFFLELDKYLMACVFWQEEWETKTKETYEEQQNIEDSMKMILKECEDKYGCKGRGYVQEISRLMNIFEDRWWSLSWKASRPRCFQKIWWKCITLNSKKKASLKSSR